MYKWTEAFPGRLEAELEAFERHPALDFELDQPRFESSGVVVLRGHLRHEDEDIQLEVVYPESFPYLRPEVFAPELNLHRHQDPLNRNLCLLDRSTRAWIPSDTGAWLVGERVPFLLDALAAGDAEMRRIEAPQGEPGSAYYFPAPGTVVFVPGEFLELPQDQVAGRAVLAIGEPERASPVLRACLTRIETRGDGGELTHLAELSSTQLTRRFPEDAFEAAWARLESLPHGTGSPFEVIEAAAAVPGFEPAKWQELPWGQIRITAVVFSEEVQQQVFEDGWLVAVEVEVKDGGDGCYFAETQRLTPSDLQARIPRISGLSEKSVAVAGLGALGAPITLELARAQIGKLQILDGDTVEAGNIVRWPFGLHIVGHLKAAVIEGAIEGDYPFTDVSGISHRIGAVPLPDEEAELSDSGALDMLLEDADLLVDATAELGVQQFLAERAHERNMPQVFAWLTEGGWGGAVARVLPGVTGCWNCLQHHLADGTIPIPPREQTDAIQPRGCTTPTFTASSFDALPVAAQAARVVCDTLLEHDADVPAHVFICSQRPEEVVPSWDSFPLEKHSACSCGSKSA